MERPPRPRTGSLAERRLTRMHWIILNLCTETAPSSVLRPPLSLPLPSSSPFLPTSSLCPSSSSSFY
eukprot:5648287-Pyramimonas_sp.AAC.1